MARLGTLRVSDVLDYERDIKGKRLVRLRAGVGAGKNYWARHPLEMHPDLQILLYTGRLFEYLYPASCWFCSHQNKDKYHHFQEKNTSKSLVFLVSYSLSLYGKGGSLCQEESQAR